MQAVSHRFVRNVSMFLMVILLLGQTGSVLAQDEQLTGVDGTSYTSPTFGYSFNWDGDLWSVDEEISDNGYDYLHLASDGSDLYIEGLYFYRGDPAECLAGETFAIADDLGLEDLNTVTDENDELIESAGDGYAYGLYELPVSADQNAQLDSVVYLECRTIVPDSVVMVITAFLDPNDVGAQEDSLFAMLDTIEMGEFEPATVDSIDLEQQIRLAGIDINTFWKGVFTDLGQRYDNPKFISFTGPVETDCGDATAGESGPFYCPSDQTVYLDIEELNGEMLPFGAVVVEMVIAHEIGHHVQELLGLAGCTQTACGPQAGSLAIELQADCFAGAWVQDAASRGFIQKSDLKRVELAVKTYLGDPPNTPMDDPDAHGSGELRDEIYQSGFIDGVSACGLE